MVEEHSLERTLPKSTALQHTHAADGQISCQEWLVQACFGTVVLCDWRREAFVALCRDVWYRAGITHSGGYNQHHQDGVRLPTRSYCRDFGIAGAEVPRDCRLLPLRSRTLHQRWQEVLRVGECKGLLKVRKHELGTSHF